jgi:hydroxyacylglutathione hydrolase
MESIGKAERMEPDLFDPQQLSVSILPAFEDNYLFVIVDKKSKTAAAIDPGDAKPVLDFLNTHSLKLTHILVTHHHGDHTGGIPLLKEHFPYAQVFCSEYDAEQGRVPAVDCVLKPGDEVTFGIGEGKRVGKVMNVAAHTLGHIAYFFDGATPWLFCGDTLFGAGSGYLFEGTPELLLKTLKQIRELKDETSVFCAHEYTEKNLWVALQLNELNPIQKEHYARIVEQRAKGQKTVPLNLGIEKQINPFLRWDTVSLKSALGLTTDLEVLAYVRKFRDLY